VFLAESAQRRSVAALFREQKIKTNTFLRRVCPLFKTCVRKTSRKSCENKKGNHAVQLEIMEKLRWL